MATQDCNARFPFVCLKENLVLVQETKTWEEALEHCRALGYELVSVQPGEDDNTVMGYVMRADTEKVGSHSCNTCKKVQVFKCIVLFLLTLFFQE